MIDLEAIRARDYDWRIHDEDSGPSVYEDRRDLLAYVDALAAQLAAAERDAARYRWLRDESHKNVAWSAKHGIVRIGAPLDAAIDAELERQP